MVVAYFINFKSDPQMHNERGLIELIKLYDTNKRSLKSEYWYANYRFSSFSCVFVFRTVLNFMHADIICEGLLDYITSSGQLHLPTCYLGHRSCSSDFSYLRHQLPLQSNRAGADALVSSQ